MVLFKKRRLKVDGKKKSASALGINIVFICMGRCCDIPPFVFSRSLLDGMHGRHQCADVCCNYEFALGERFCASVCA